MVGLKVRMGTLAAETGQYGTSLVLIKEDLEFEEETEATDEWVGMEEEEQGDVGAEELFAYERVFDGEEPEVPDRDPLSMDYDEFFEGECSCGTHEHEKE